jgi:hypothetical protein
MIQPRRTKFAEYVERYWGKAECTQKPLEKCKHEWEDNIEVDLRESDYEMTWTRLICVRIRTDRGNLRKR